MAAIPFPPVVIGPISGALVQTVNARDLHAFLKVGRDFTTWIRSRLAKYGFVADVDYVIDAFGSANRGNQSASTTEEVFPKSGENLGGRPATDYVLTMDTAKELSMVENNEQGRLARRYFIDCERRAKEAHAAASVRPPETFPELPIASTRTQLVAECRRIYGPRAAHKLWARLIQPDLPEMVVAAAPGVTLFSDVRDAWCDRILGALASVTGALDARKLMVRAAVANWEFSAVIRRLEDEGLVQGFMIHVTRHYRLPESRL